MQPQALDAYQDDADATIPAAGHEMRSHRRARAHGREFVLITSPYGDYMVPLEIRRRRFKVFVQRACDHAKLTRGWSVPRVARETGVGVATLYRWLNEEWTDNPKPEQIEKFCDGLDLSPVEAFMILWPGKKGQSKEPPIMMTEPDFEILQRKLNDPKIPEREKFHIRETVRTLALRGK